VPNKSDLKLLVLDDDSFMLRLLDRLLKNLGHKAVALCDNGSAALALVDQPEQRPDLILLDINMPHMDGVEFVRHLVDHRFAGALILVSGEDERMLQSVEKLVRAHKITVLGCLSKPVTAQRLARMIDRWLPASTALDPSSRTPYSAEELRLALDNGELVNYYQPKVAVATGDFVGVETLVRWLHPKEGLIMPNQFVGLTEKYELIDQLTRTVLINALDQARAWQEANLPLRLAVNLSMDNLVSLNFLGYVVNLTKLVGVPPQTLVLEVTESRLMNDPRIPLEILTRLRLNRFRLSIDDFGTGNSSLTQLHNIPFDELKIDQSFVHGAWANETQRAIFDASLGLARQLKMETVAEGVEDLADWNFVQQRGCDLAQGFFIGRPMPAQELPAWLLAWNERRGRLVAQAVAQCDASI
jgi:EAL domain-containing protein (putative c-di-GMP-specific phosphodiesterase class I)/CheY-like chemotaxis protein